ncbi:META domain-containing protein [Streptomyces sp. NPDC004111]|uniref:META domain-containing protein n=1 Tax=Streptomyces sp. NPDC004111 TaxID=3364690 RepID=UPI0036A0CCAB
MILRTSQGPRGLPARRRASVGLVALLCLAAACDGGAEGRAAGSGARSPGAAPPAPVPSGARPFRAAELPPGAPFPLTGVQWRFTDPYTYDNYQAPDLENAYLYLSDDLSVQGNYGCHYYTGRASFPEPGSAPGAAQDPFGRPLLTGVPLAFHDITVRTKEGCTAAGTSGTPESVKRELESRVRQYSTMPYESTLTLSEGEGVDEKGVHAEHRPLTAQELGPVTGTKWYPDKPNWPVRADRTAPYLWFEEGGAVHGHTGCRPFTARLTVEPGPRKMAFGEVRAQGGDGCADTDERTYEKKFLDRLDSPWTYTQRFRTLYLNTAGEKGTFVLYTPGPPGPVRRTAPPPSDTDGLVGPRWKVRGSSGNDGSGAYFQVARDGHVLGHTGCEVFTARAAVSSAELNASHVAEATVNGDQGRCTPGERAAGRDFLARFAAGFRYTRDPSGTGWRAEPSNGSAGFTLVRP